MANEATQVLAEFAASLQYENFPEHVRESCKNLLLDALACAVAGGHGDETEQVLVRIRRSGSGFEPEEHEVVSFVPLLGRYGRRG